MSDEVKPIPGGTASPPNPWGHIPPRGNLFPLDPDGGFTLLELLLAFALSSILLASLYGTFILSQRALEGRDGWMVKLQESRMALDTLRREIESALNRPDPDSLLFKLEGRDLYGRSGSRLVFLTYSPLLPGPSLVSYRLEERDGEMVLLKRLEAPPTAYGEKGEGRWVEMLEGIDSFLVEAYDGGIWIKTWDASERKGLPEQVRVTIEISWKERRVSLRQVARPRIEKTL